MNYLPIVLFPSGEGVHMTLQSEAQSEKLVNNNPNVDVFILRLYLFSLPKGLGIHKGIVGSPA